MRDLQQLRIENPMMDDLTIIETFKADIYPAIFNTKDILVEGTTVVVTSTSDNLNSEWSTSNINAADIKISKDSNASNFMPEKYDLVEEANTTVQFIDLNNLPDESNIISNSTTLLEAQEEDLSLTFADDEYVSTFVLDVAPKIKNYTGYCKYDILTSALTYCFDLCFSAYSFGTIGLLILLYLYTSIIQTTALTALFNTIAKLSSKNKRNFIETTIKYYKGTRRFKVFISTVYLSIF